MVDPKVSRDDVVSMRPVRTLPLDPPGRPTTETVRRSRECSPVVEGCAKRVGVFATLVPLAKPPRHLARYVDKLLRSTRHRTFETRTQRSERGRDLRDLCEPARHRSVLEERSELQLLGGEFDIAPRVQLERDDRTRYGTGHYVVLRARSCAVQNPGCGLSVNPPFA